MSAFLPVFLVAYLACASDVVDSVDPKLPEYKPDSTVKGTLKCVGSDTMIDLMSLWGEGFKKHHPDVEIEVQGKGPDTGPPALSAGTADLAPMGREWKQSELDEFVKKHGYRPTVLTVAVNSFAICVHKDNPIKQLSMEQLDAIFSKQRKGGFEKDIKTWGDVGLTKEWADRPINLYTRRKDSASADFFRERVLLGGEFKDSAKETVSLSGVGVALEADKFGIGFGYSWFKEGSFRFVPLVAKGKAHSAEPSAANVQSGDYPLAQPMFIYINDKPKSELDPIRREFLLYILSKDGQELASKCNYTPINAKMAKAAIQAVGIQHKE